MREGSAGLVYFIASEKAIKIGYTTRSPGERLAALQTGSPEPLEVLAVLAPASLADERAIHRALAAHRLHGEWFDREPVEALVALLPQLTVIGYTPYHGALA